MKMCEDEKSMRNHGLFVCAAAKKRLKLLISLAPTQGRRLKDGKEEMILAEEIQQSDILRILPGETIPVDGKFH